MSEDEQLDINVLQKMIDKRLEEKKTLELAQIGMSNRIQMLLAEIDALEETKEKLKKYAK